MHKQCLSKPLNLFKILLFLGDNAAGNPARLKATSVRCYIGEPLIIELECEDAQGNKVPLPSPEVSASDFTVNTTNQDIHVKVG